jgi:hypothetical protein
VQKARQLAPPLLGHSQTSYDATASGAIP